VYDDLLVPAGVSGLSLSGVIILGKVIVQGRGVTGTIYRPLGVTDFAEVARGNDGLNVVRRPRNDLLRLAKGL
jgi:hypothetical protein